MSFENDIPDWRTYKDGDYYMQSVPPYFWGEYEGLAQRVEDENCLELLRGLAAIVRYVIQKVSTQVAPNAALRLSECVLSRDGYDFPVKFLAVNMYKLNASI